jgi:hypothetical protein
VRFEFESGIVSFCFSFIFLLFEESCLLVSWCVGGRCGMPCSDENHAGVGDLVQRTGNGRIGFVLGGRATERSGDTVCGLQLVYEWFG